MTISDSSGSPRGGAQRIPRPPRSRHGGPPPWAGLAPEARRLSLAQVRARCAALPAAFSAVTRAPESRDAAVLVALFEADGEARVILTKRPETMPSHRGEIAFPGGSVQPGVDSSARAAALREAHEEIGLDPSAVDVVAQLDGIGTVASQFVITPFVGILESVPRLRPDTREVVRVFDVALSELLDDATYREEHWPLSPRGPESELTVCFFELEGETVWGATARILSRFLARMVGTDGTWS